MNAQLGARGKIGLREALATNVLNMVGIGPFITIPLILSAMGGPQAILGWGLGALLSLCDGLVWAELGAAMPGSGGSYLYLKEAYGPNSLGRYMSFLFLFQTLFAAPLLTASGGVGFTKYAQVLLPPMADWQIKAMAAGVCLIATFLLYRNIRSIGRLSAVLFVVVVGTMAWIIFAGATHFHPAMAFTFPPNAFHFSPAFFTGLAAATLLAMYDYQGYFTVCLIGDEVEQPARTIPRAILYAIFLLAVCYGSMSVAVIGVVPWPEAAKSNAIVTDLLQRVYGPGAAVVAAGLIMVAAFGSVYVVLLGYTRVPYAAAVKGEFFRAFARVHPKGFPSFSVVSLGIASALCCVLSLDWIINALLIIQIVTQFLPQAVAVFFVRWKRKEIPRPFSMYLYPLPAVINVAGWTFILVSAERQYLLTGAAALTIGSIAYVLRARSRREWPFAAAMEAP